MIHENLFLCTTQARKQNTLHSSNKMKYSHQKKKCSNFKPITSQNSSERSENRRTLKTQHHCSRFTLIQYHILQVCQTSVSNEIIYNEILSKINAKSYKIKIYTFFGMSIITLTIDISTYTHLVMDTELKIPPRRVTLASCFPQRRGRRGGRSQGQLALLNGNVFIERWLRKVVRWPNQQPMMFQCVSDANVVHLPRKLHFRHCSGGSLAVAAQHHVVRQIAHRRPIGDGHAACASR